MNLGRADMSPCTLLLTIHRLLRYSQKRIAIIVENANVFFQWVAANNSPATQELFSELRSLPFGLTNENLLILIGQDEACVATSASQEYKRLLSSFQPSVIAPVLGHYQADARDADFTTMVHVPQPNLAELNCLLDQAIYEGRVFITPSERDEFISALNEAVGNGYRCTGLYRALLKAAQDKKDKTKSESPITVDDLRQQLLIPKGKDSEAMLDGLIGMDPIKEKIKAFRSLDAPPALLPKDDVDVTTLDIAELFAHPVQSDPEYNPDPLLSRPAPKPAKLDFAKNIILTGPAGVGKTSVAKIIGRVLYEKGVLASATLVFAHKSDLCGENAAITAQRTRSFMMSHLGRMIFIDEAYKLADADGKPCVDEIVELLTEQPTLTIALAGYPRDIKRLLSVNEGLASRFGTHFRLPHYTAAETCAIFKSMLRQENLMLTPELEQQLPAICDQLCDWTDKDWANGRTTELERNEILRNYRLLPDQPTVEKDGVQYKLIDERCFSPKLRRCLIRSQHVPMRPATAAGEIDALIGHPAFKSFWGGIHRFAGHMAELSAFVDAPTLDCVFVGNEGAGKAHVAELYGRALREAGLLSSGHVTCVSRASLVGAHIGESEHRTADALETAEGGILFVQNAAGLIDEDDQTSADSAAAYGCKALDTLLSATGSPDRVIIFGVSPGAEEKFTDYVTRRSGSVPPRIDMPDYTDIELLQLFNVELEKLGMAADQPLLDKLSAFFNTWNRSRGEAWKNADEVVSLARQIFTGVIDRPEPRTTEISGTSWHVISMEDFPPPYQPFLRDVKVTRDAAMDEINQMIGLNGVKEYMASMRALAAHKTETGASRNTIFAGEPGTGKTTTARLLARLLHDFGVLDRGHVYEITAGALISGAVTISAAYEKARGGILFIDEAHQLAQVPSLYRSLIPYLENKKDQVLTVLAGYEDTLSRLQNVDAGTESRFPNIVKFESYKPEELCAIAMLRLKNDLKYTFDNEDAFRAKLLEELSPIHRTGATKNGNGRFVRDRLVPELLLLQIRALEESGCASDCPLTTLRTDALANLHTAKFS